MIPSWTLSVAALALLAAAPSLAAQTTGRGVPCARYDYDDTTPPCVIGRVIDAATKRPIVLAEVSEGHEDTGFARTDSTGTFAMFAHAGDISLSASRNDYAVARRQVGLHDYKTTVVDFRLHRLPAPCCRLVGQWHVKLTLVHQQPGVKPTARVVSGRMLFDPKIASPLPLFVNPPDDSVRMESGRFDIDLTPFLGSQVREHVSTTGTRNSEASFLRDVVGTVFPGDTIELTLIPNLSHGSIVVTGTIAGDSITGAWYEQAYAAAASGHLSMHRFSRTTPELHEPPPPPPPRPQDRSTWGKARVRVWEASRGRYIVATHALKFPDSSEVSAYHTHASAEGWGDTIELPPGGYTILLMDFPNGDQMWRVPAKSARHFTISTGQTTDVTIRLNLATGAVLDSASRP
jgi:hypothetical protein